MVLQFDDNERRGGRSSPCVAVRNGFGESGSFDSTDACRHLDTGAALLRHCAVAASSSAYLRMRKASCGSISLTKAESDNAVLRSIVTASSRRSFRSQRNMRPEGPGGRQRFRQ